MEKWLKKIFSLQTLGIVIAIVSAYYGYKQFVRDEPGQISLATGKFSLDDNIRWIFIGFDLENDVTDLKHMLNIPLFGNLGEQPIEDVFMCGSIMEKGLSFEESNCYSFRKGEEVKHEYPIVFSTRMEKLPYFSFFPFPINKVKNDVNKGLHISVNMAYTYKGHPNLENYFFILAGIPQKNRNNSQEAFAKHIMPYLIKLNKQDSVAIIYNDIVVTHLKKLSEINNESFYNSLKTIKDFER